MSEKSKALKAAVEAKKVTTATAITEYAA